MALHHRLRGFHRFAGRASSRPIFQCGDGSNLPVRHRTLPVAAGDSIQLQLPGTGLPCASTSRLFSSGVGTHLDRQPEVFCALRRVDPKDPVAQAGFGLSRSTRGPHAGKLLVDANLADLFGIEIADVASLDNPLARHHPSTTTKTKNLCQGTPRDRLTRTRAGRRANRRRRATPRQTDSERRGWRK